LVAKGKTSAARTAAKRKAPARQLSSREVAKVFAACVRRGNPALKHVADELRRLVKRAVTGSRETINPWGIPTFDFYGPICFLMVGKNHVTFGFSRATSLVDSAGLLEGTGKNLRHLKLKQLEQVRDPNLRKLIVEAAALNRETPLRPSMRVQKET
jgi:hypothetical protein